MIFRDRLANFGEFVVDGLALESLGGLGDMLGTSMVVTLKSSSGYVRHFHGLVMRSEARGPVVVGDERFHLYRFDVVSSFQLLGKSSRSRIFKGLSVPDIVVKVCRENGLNDVDLRLISAYPVRDYCVQYRESHLDFTRRIMEEAGIYFHVEHHEDRHVLVLSDAMASHRCEAGFERVAFVPDVLWGKRSEMSIKAWAIARTMSTGAVRLDDYDYLHPRTSLGASGSAEPSRQGAGELVDFPARGGGFAQDPEDIRRQAMVRWEALNVDRVTSRGETDAIGMAVGRRFTLDDHPSPELNREYLVTGTTMRLCAAPYRSEGGAETAPEPPFSCSFTALPVDHDFRSPLGTPRPMIPGVQTAVVCGDAKDEDVVVDEYGRVNVAFFWDRDATSCPVRVASAWAGNRWGAVSLPRIGQEVVVCFLEGDPDRPLIIGSVYNQDHMPPYALPDGKTRSGIVSRSLNGDSGDANEIRFEDRKGKEELLLHAQRDLREEAENDRFVSAERDAKETSGRDLAVEAGRDRKQGVGRDDTLKVGRKLHIQAMDQIELSVGPARLVMKKTGEVQITGTMVKINGMASAEMSGGGTLAIKAGASLSMVAGATVSMTGGAAVSVNAGAALTLSAVGPAMLKGLPPLLG